VKLSKPYNKEEKKMGKLFSPSWWVSMFVSTFVTMFFIYLIKKGSEKYNIPVVRPIAEAV
ncbi:hypothetical protein P4K19_31790, partial [Bacillus cereus]|nr:hypothetical protein [Bacillus cereus]